MSPCLLDFYIYVYIERDRESIQQEINFICKSFRQRRYHYLQKVSTSLYISTKNTATSIKLTNSFFTNFDRNTNIKKIDEKIIATKLRETILTITNHNLHKSS